jgi:ribonuclease HI
MEKLFINTDGGSRRNPGPAAIGVVFYNPGEEEIYSQKEYIGEGTNNEAEYRAIIKALEILSKSKWAKENEGRGKVICRLDSELVVEQICGRYKVKKNHIYELAKRVKELVASIGVQIEFIHIPREQNKEADKLVNEALDEHEKACQ